MKHNQIIIGLTIFFLMSSVIAKAENDAQDLQNKLKEKLAEQNDNGPIRKKLKKHHNKRLVSLYFENEDLIDVINFLAAEKAINVVLPVGAAAINNKITLHLEEKVTIQEAWDMLYTILDIAGYSLITRADTYHIVKTSKDVTREPVPLYIGIKPDLLPDSDQRIRYLYYLSNLKVGDQPNSELEAIIKDILPDTGSYKIDPQTNGVLICDKSNNIRQLMRILVAFDEAEVQDKPDILKLQHVSADMVANLFNEQILRNITDPNKLRLLDTRKQSEANYFARTIRIFPLSRHNRLMLLGKPQAIERVREFIQKYIDVELDSGKSILHTYQLQYLDADKFAPILERIVESKKEGGTDQSRSEGAAHGGVDRYFDEFRITTDKPKTATGEAPEGVSLGTNSLIIACRNDDWDIIKKIIHELDTPQPQVIIEVLVADLSADDVRALGASLRNPAIISPQNVNFQSAQTEPVLTNSNTDPTTLQSDLLRKAFDNTNPPNPGSDRSAASVPAYTPVGATVLSLSDPTTGSTWSVWQLLQSFASTRVLSHPHVIGSNNKRSDITIKEERLLDDEGSGTTGGTTTATKKWITAKLELQITPRISSLATTNLNVKIDIEDFINSANSGTLLAGNRTTRNVTTNANIPSGSVLCIGGLTRVDTENGTRQTPILGQIPIIGWFFKKRTGDFLNRNLMVFICPTVIQPRFRGGAGAYTRDHVELAKDTAREGLLFDALHDPITRWFFRVSGADQNTKDIDKFIMRDELISRDLGRKGTVESLVVADAKQPEKTIPGNKPEQTIVASQPTEKDVRTNQLKQLLATSEEPSLGTKQS